MLSCKTDVEGLNDDIRANSGVLRHMQAAQAAGYGIALHYVSVASPDLAPAAFRGCRRNHFSGDDVVGN